VYNVRKTVVVVVTVDFAGFLVVVLSCHLIPLTMVLFFLFVFAGIGSVMI